MDEVLRRIPALKSQLKKSTSDIVRSGNILGTGPHGQVEELVLRGQICAGKKLYRILFDLSEKESKLTLERFASNCQLLSGLNHPNIAVFYGLDIFISNSTKSESFALIREYAKNTLPDFLDANPILPLSVKISILLDVTKALEYLHTSKPAIIHGNLTSSNVLITDSMQAKVADMECSCFNVPTIIKKKSPFISPEAFDSKLEKASDMFSFGNVALHLITHILPEKLVPGSTEIEKRADYMFHLKDAEKILRDLIVNCLQDTPSKRPTVSTTLNHLILLDEKLTLKGDNPHGHLRRMTTYKMVGQNMTEDEQDVFKDGVSDKNDDIKQLQVNVAQIKGGVPNVLYLDEVITTFGVRGIKKQQKWVEYKFQISDGFLQYSKLNGQVLKKVALRDVTYITAHRKLGELDIHPFYVRFQSNDCWILGAHTDDLRKSWMEAILPGSTYNQWCDCPGTTHQPIKRSSTSPTPFAKPSSDPAYIKFNEINVPDAHSKPPPIPERPRETMESTDSPYLTLLPSDEVKDKRAEVISNYTIEQLHLMIDMFEKNGDIQSTKQQTDNQRKRTSSESIVLRNNPISVNERSSKHPSKGLYYSYAEISGDMKAPPDWTKNSSEIPEEKSSPTENSSEASTEDSKPIESTATAIESTLAPVPTESKEEEQSSGSAKGLYRQNAVRHSLVRDSPTRESIAPKSALRTILRQQSSEEMLDRDDKPEWSKAQLDNINVEESTKEQVPDFLNRTDSEHIIATKDLQDFSSITIGHYGAVYRAELVDSANVSKRTIVTVKTMRKQTDQEWIGLLQTFSILKSKSRHPNVVNLLGVVPENNWIVMEYTALGDLKRYLTCNKLSSSRLIKYMCDIAMGMHHIKALGLVHRNLALRNVLVMEDHTCKVADLMMKNTLFSVTNFDAGHVIYPHTDQRRWMSPENLYRGIFSEASDVWSFGVVQWEMLQPVRVPYSSLNASRFPQHINSGHTLEIPDTCPDIVARIMRACWNWNPSKRPSFMYIASLLMQYTLLHECDYH